MNGNCLYCKKELFYPWELRRYVCDDCEYAITDTYHEEWKEEKNGV
ncbi:hypothetical protein [Pseudalkalibacillus caeni]|nr:hypothetical protein [Pseudalkalibacillus caeni]